MTSHNPFRRPEQTPAATGETVSSLPSYRSQDESGPPLVQNEPWRDIALPPSPTREEPPPYSATPDLRGGESTVEVGPRRPFQGRQQQQQQQQQEQQRPPPRVTPQPTGYVNPQSGYLSPHTSGYVPQRTGVMDQWNSLVSDVMRGSGFTPNRITPQPTGYLSSQPSGYAQTNPGYLDQWNTLAPNTSQSSGFTPGPRQPTPPPRHPSLSERSLPPRQTQPQQTRPASENLSAFARDFYAAGADADVERDAPPIPGSYAPPPGPPPPRRPRSTDPPASNSQPPADGRPTTTPVPGHPLLYKNRVLVYPRNYQCSKCHNTGYKAYDPSSPCRRCWDEHSKPFTGPITYAPWNTSAVDSNYQKPLPTIGRPSNSNGYPGNSVLQHSRSFSDITRPSIIGRTPSVSVRIPGFAPPASPNHLVVPPGDPRIGGRLCWKCYGKGSMTFLIFEETCSACGGIGRIMG